MQNLRHAMQNLATPSVRSAPAPLHQAASSGSSSFDESIYCLIACLRGTLLLRPKLRISLYTQKPIELYRCQHNDTSINQAAPRGKTTRTVPRRVRPYRAKNHIANALEPLLELTLFEPKLLQLPLRMQSGLAPPMAVKRSKEGPVMAASRSGSRSRMRGLGWSSRSLLARLRTHSG